MSYLTAVHKRDFVYLRPSPLLNKTVVGTATFLVICTTKMADKAR